MHEASIQTFSDIINEKKIKNKSIKFRVIFI